MTSMTDPLDFVNTYEYDAVDNLTKVTDPLLRETEFEYDLIDRLVHQTNADNKKRLPWL